MNCMCKWHKTERGSINFLTVYSYIATYCFLVSQAKPCRVLSMARPFPANTESDRRCGTERVRLARLKALSCNLPLMAMYYSTGKKTLCTSSYTSLRCSSLIRTRSCQLKTDILIYFEHAAATIDHAPHLKFLPKRKCLE